MLLGNRTIINQAEFESRYTIGEELGRGSNAVVYAARDTLKGKVVAVKVLQKSPPSGNEPEAHNARLMRDEMLAMSALAHPHIIALDAIFESDDRLALVMEKAEGGEVFDGIVAHGFFEEAEARVIMGQLLSALSHMHARGAIHRDIKPENILFASRTSWDIKAAEHWLHTRRAPFPFPLSRALASFVAKGKTPATEPPCGERLPAACLPRRAGPPRHRLHVQ